MKEINDIKINELKENSVVTIGTFDGVHIGHQKIIKTLINKAKKLKLKSVVLTFFPHPRMVLQKDSDIKLINTLAERSKKFKELGLDFLIIEEFTEKFSRLSAVKFVRDILVNKLNARHIIIGYDHRFGRNRSADINDLKQFGETFNFKVHKISVQDIEEVAVSSTKIRQAIIEGHIKKANKYLGYNFMLTGRVIKGKGLGKTIGFPTANLFIEESYKLIPKNGVYVISCNYNGRLILGMMNIGTNPTVNGEDQSIEIHFFDFNRDIYGEKLQIDLHTRLRDERKFISVEALKEQIKIDQQNALQYLEHNVS